jgi:hypothetical protein
MKSFCLTIDDNIRFLKELTEGELPSLFDHPYPAMLRRLHERFALKVQLNLFYRTDGFDLSGMSERYRGEWADNADWLKLSFHSRLENVCPYAASGYGEVYEDCHAVHSQILRFASAASLAETTTVHCCETTKEGLRALADNGVRGLLGLFGDHGHPRTSYGLDGEAAELLRGGRILYRDGMAYAPIDMVINCFSMSRILPTLSSRLSQDTVRVMIHEQYFYKDYFNYQSDYEQKLYTLGKTMQDAGFIPIFPEDILELEKGE